MKDRVAQAPGDVLWIGARGVAGEEMFRDAFDYAVFLHHLSGVKRRRPFHLLAYVLVPRGVDLLIGVQEVGASGLAHRILRPYSRYFNRKYLRTGHAIEKRHSERVCHRFEDLLKALREIHGLPVKLGLAGRPEEWLWSGYRELLGMRPRLMLDEALPMESFRSEKMEGLARDIRKLLFPMRRQDPRDWRPADPKRRRRCRA